ncbi:hypothetical protein DFJ58DRAFT_840325 [Suillus subalutaceus]|uniref:uncharacterized protein n=1 Tax=Suillus subalutaceus TaxID=48586 RepID=UPI001B870877|nr:uncharacterized protein DFJ58DRAFT_840325 [Suillus subalutaceus]KAG1858730.1 hypothetical protein DFJ58DRAFT_840325 [Suillus subalutaceus]
MKPYSRVLTSAEGRAELRELEAEQAERERQDEANKQKKLTEEQEKRDRRAEQEHSQVAFTGAIKAKKLEELRDIAAALRLSESGLKAEVFQRILQHLDEDPDLKKNPRYEGLFNPTHSHRRRLDDGNNTAELQQDAIPPPNPVHEPFGHQPQPALEPSMSRNRHLEFPLPGCTPPYYPMQHPAPQPHPLHISHPHFTPASHSNVDFGVGNTAQTQQRY